MDLLKIQETFEFVPDYRPVQLLEAIEKHGVVGLIIGEKIGVQTKNSLNSKQIDQLEVSARYMAQHYEVETLFDYFVEVSNGWSLNSRFSTSTSLLFAL